MAVAGNYHFPCIIYMREGGDPVGLVPETPEELREQRLRWVLGHDPRSDPICRQNCLDVCTDYNNTARLYHAVAGDWYKRR